MFGAVHAALIWRYATSARVIYALDLTADAEPLDSSETVTPADTRVVAEFPSTQITGGQLVIQDSPALPDDTDARLFSCEVEVNSASADLWHAQAILDAALLETHDQLRGYPEISEGIGHIDFCTWAGESGPALRDPETLLWRKTGIILVRYFLTINQ